MPIEKYSLVERIQILQDVLQDLARQCIFLTGFLQQLYFQPESCKICIFCQDLAKILQELYLFSTRVLLGYLA